MQVVAAVDQPLIFAGDRVKLRITFAPTPSPGQSIVGVPAAGLATPQIPSTPRVGHLGSGGAGPESKDESPHSPKIPSSPASTAFSSDSETDNGPPLILSGYAAVQGSFKLGDMILAEPFAETRKKGVVMGHHGIGYGSKSAGGMQGSGLLAGVIGGLKQLMIHDSAYPTGNAGGNGDEVDEGDYPIYATNQTLLFTDLLVDQPHHFELTVDLPRELPPSYRSRSIYVSYHVVVGFQSLGSLSRRSSSYSYRGGPPVSQQNRGPLATRLFLPFRVYTRHQGPYDLRMPIIAPAPAPWEGTNEIGNLENGPDDMSGFVESLLSRRRKSSSATMPRRGSFASKYTRTSFDIAKSGVSIATLVLARPTIRVGDVLTGVLHLLRPCLHIAVFLELGETIAAPYAAASGAPSVHPRHGPGATNSDAGAGNGNSNSRRQSSDTSSDIVGNGDDTDTQPEGQAQTHYQTYARQSLGTYALDEVAIHIPTLNSIAPRLDTVQIKAEWSLRIDFIGIVGTAFAEKEASSNIVEGLVAKGQVDSELFSCRIPITVLPPDSGGHGPTKVWAIH